MSKSTRIDPRAIVEQGARIEEGVTVEAYAVVKSTVTLKAGAKVMSHAYIEGNTTIGEGTVIYPFASIGTKTQDLKYRGETTYVEIGKGCEIREYVTINSSSGEGTKVIIGESCLIMAYCHIAHNCEIGNNVIMSNNATLAGHVIIEDNAIIGGLTPIHQFVRVGKYAMVGGMSRIPYDVPPFTIGAGIPFKFGGLNIVGLKRHGFSLKTRSELSRAFKWLYRSKLLVEEALEKIETELEPLPEIAHFVKFCRESKRGLIGLQGAANEEGEFAEEEEPAELYATVK